MRSVVSVYGYYLYVLDTLPGIHTEYSLPVFYKGSTVHGAYVPVGAIYSTTFSTLEFAGCVSVCPLKKRREKYAGGLSRGPPAAVVVHRLIVEGQYYTIVHNSGQAENDIDTITDSTRIRLLSAHFKSNMILAVHLSIKASI